MKQLTPRTRTFIFAGLALLAVWLLATTLGNLTLDPGQPLPLYQLTPPFNPVGGPDSLSEFLLAAVRVLLVVAWLSVPLLIVLFIVSKEWRRRILRDLAFLVPILVILYLFSTAKFNQRAAEELNPQGFSAGDIATQLAGTPTAPPPVFTPPPSWVTSLATVGLAVVIALILAGVGYAFWWRSRLPVPGPLAAIEKEAQAAIDSIQAGGDLREVILRCYYQMIEAVRQYRNIERDRDMTPREFELYLERRGLPSEPVRQLTQLFEQVRYGGSQPGRQEERSAVSSLSAIVSACRKTVGGG